MSATVPGVLVRVLTDPAADDIPAFGLLTGVVIRLLAAGDELAIRIRGKRIRGTIERRGRSWYLECELGYSHSLAERAGEAADATFLGTRGEALADEQRAAELRVAELANPVLLGPDLRGHFPA